MHEAIELDYSPEGMRARRLGRDPEDDARRARSKPFDGGPEARDPSDRAALGAPPRRARLPRKLLEVAMRAVLGRFRIRAHPGKPDVTTSGGPPHVEYVEDLRLVRDALGGDPGARERFARRMRCIGRILALRNARSGRPLGEHDLADLAQEVALSVWRRLDSYSGEAALESWVYSFCSFGWLSTSRRRRSAPRAEREYEPAAPDAPEGASRSEIGIERYLRHLSAREAEVLRARHVDGLDNREIARALSISVNSVKTHSANGMRKLREILGGSERELRG